jgi:hypothetical protein
MYTTLFNAIRGLAALCGLDPLAFGGHSLRIGRATTLALLGFPAHVIQTLDLRRWRSLSYQLYVRLGLPQFARISEALGTSSVKDGKKFEFGKAQSILESAFSPDDAHMGVAFGSTR